MISAIFPLKGMFRRNTEHFPKKTHIWKIRILWNELFEKYKVKDILKMWFYIYILMKKIIMMRGEELWASFYLGLAEFVSFSSRKLSWSSKRDTFWHVVSKGYFCVLFLWVIAVSDLFSVEIYKKLKPFLV